MYERPYNPYRNNIEIVKDYFKSPSVLVLGILNIVSVIFSFVSALLIKDFVRDILSGIAEYFDSNADASYQNSSFSDALHQAAANSDTFSLIGSVSLFTILTAVGLFLIYAKSRNTDPDAAPKAGVMILYVLAVLSMIGAILTVIGMLLLAALLFVLYAEYSKQPGILFSINVSGTDLNIDETFILIFAISLTVIAAIVGFFMLFFVINRVRFIGSVRSSMKSVELSRSGAKPFGVMCVIFAVFSGLSMLSSVSSLFVGNSINFSEIGLNIKTNTTLPMILSLVSQVVAVAILIFEAKIALGYAKHIDNKKFGYGEPAVQPDYPDAGADRQNTPYSYLAHQQPEVSMKEATFVNPYAPQEDTDEDDQRTVLASSVCPKCGSHVENNSPYCGHCGAKL